MNDDELLCMLEVRERRNLATQRLYDKYRPAIAAWGSRYSRLLPTDVLEEIPHTTLATAFKVIEASGYEERGTFRKWLYSIFRNKVREALREHRLVCGERVDLFGTQKVEGDPLDQLPIPMVNQHESLEIREIAEFLKQGISLLPKADQYLVRKRLRGMQYQDIGEALGITEEAARKRMQRCRERLAKYLESIGVDTQMLHEICG